MSADPALVQSIRQRLENQGRGALVQARDNTSACNALWIVS
jgi:hypothetical protein